jgi:hypothetical protein
LRRYLWNFHEKTWTDRTGLFLRDFKCKCMWSYVGYLGRGGFDLSLTDFETFFSDHVSITCETSATRQSSLPLSGFICDGQIPVGQIIKPEIHMYIWY